MYGIFTYIYHKNIPNVGKYAIHWASGMVKHGSDWFGFDKKYMQRRQPQKLYQNPRGANQTIHKVDPTSFFCRAP